VAGCVDFRLAGGQCFVWHVPEIFLAGEGSGYGAGQPRGGHHDAGAGLGRTAQQCLVQRTHESSAIEWLFPDFQCVVGQSLALVASLS